LFHNFVIVFMTPYLLYFDSIGILKFSVRV